MNSVIMVLELGGEIFERSIVCTSIRYMYMPYIQLHKGYVVVPLKEYMCCAQMDDIYCYIYIYKPISVKISSLVYPLYTMYVIIKVLGVSDVSLRCSIAYC